MELLSKETEENFLPNLELFADVISDDSYHYAEKLKEFHEELKKFQWQPMETAPKDGTEILIKSSEDDGGVRVCFWGNENEWTGMRKTMGWCVVDSLQDEQGGYNTNLNPKSWMNVPQ